MVDAVASGKFPPLDLRLMSRVLELAPEDMTVTVESGVTVAALQERLAAHGQWLPIDPPFPEGTAIHEVLARDLSGPRRFGCGTIREHLIGMKVALASGRLIKSGGKVVKNVAGYDLARLFIGARDSLGIIVEATFKVRPRPEEERLFVRRLPAADLAAALRAILDSALAPVILDCHRLSGAAELSLVLGLAGTRAEVEWQLEAARQLGFESGATLDYETAFWKEPGRVERLSVLPTRLTEAIERLGAAPFVARAGNGVLYHRGARTENASPAPAELMRRVKAAYDPNGLLPEFIP